MRQVLAVDPINPISVRWLCAALAGCLVACGGSGVTGDHDEWFPPQDAVEADGVPDAAPEADVSTEVGDADASPGESDVSDAIADAEADVDDPGDVASDLGEVASEDTASDVGPEEVTEPADVAEDVEPSDASEDVSPDVAPDVVEPPPECLVDDDCPEAATCHHAYCDQDTSTCMVEQMADGVSCEDGTACSEEDTCQGGVCFGGVALSCDDDNVCTDDVCNPSTGCVYAYNFGACDDGNGCTDDDLCIAGVCAGQKPACDDANPCTSDFCVPGTAECVNSPNDLEPCSDDNECTGGDHCTSGTCIPGELDGCDDGNDCTVDSCEEGVCKTIPLEDEPCDDGEVCTVGDLCQLAVCIPGQPNACDDENPCTSDSCEPGVGCVHVSLVDQPCDDGDVCTQGEVCDAQSVCVAASTTDCDDGNPCTVDNCHPINDCVSALKSGPCDDGNPCTAGDHCVVGQCKGQLGTCNDDDACTHDSCDETLGCQFVSIAASCVDDDLCTDDACDPAVGCTFTHNAAGCDDGLVCTEEDTCSEGTCEGQPVDCADEDACTAETCDPEEGCVVVVVPDAPCDDGDLCTENATCDAAGTCGSGESISVDDGIDCTIDACTPAEGLTHVADDGLCPVGRVCNPVSGCVPGAVVLLVTKIAWTEGEGLEWVAIFNAGEGDFDLRGLSLADDTHSAHLVAANGDTEASILLAPGATAAAVRVTDAVADPASEGFTMIFGALDDDPGLLPTGGNLRLIDAQDFVYDAVDFSSVTTDGAVGPSEFPVAPGSATEFDATATAVAVGDAANDPAGLWCTWPTGASAPEGPQLPCSRARLNEISLTGADGERWVELHMPAGGHLEGLMLRVSDVDGQHLAQIGPLAGRTPMSSLVLVQDGVDGVVLPQLSEGSVQLVRAGILLDAFGFGALTANNDDTFNLPLLEGTASAAMAADEVAARLVDGQDTDDNSVDWQYVATGTPGTTNSP